jgi:hypothetical protein
MSVRTLYSHIKEEESWRIRTKDVLRGAGIVEFIKSPKLG